MNWTSIYNPLYAIVLYISIIALCFLCYKKFKPSLSDFRYKTLDGLRGLLATGVFVHHTAVWYQALKTDNWTYPLSSFYRHLGETSISLFFMVTSFLFVSRLIETKDKGMNWKNYFISRFFRMAPAFYFAALITLIIAFAMSNWQIKATPAEFGYSFLQWLLFTVFDTPTFNNYEVTGGIMAWVIWTMPYEWFFYCALPALSLFFHGKKTNIIFFIVSAAIIFLMLKKLDLAYTNFLPFAAGALASLIVKKTSFAQLMESRRVNAVASCIVLLIGFCVTRCGHFNEWPCVTLTFFAFLLIAGGADVFGVLVHPLFRFLGELSYSIYLLHGILLFSLFNLVLGMETAKELSVIQYTLLMSLITIPLVFVSFLSYRFIEQPFMRMAKNINANSTRVPET